MNVQTFETYSIYILVGGLVCYMGYIVWDLAKRSNAGKFGTAILFIVLGLGVVGFVAKTIIVEVMGL